MTEAELWTEKIVQLLGGIADSEGLLRRLGLDAPAESARPGQIVRGADRPVFPPDNHAGAIVKAGLEPIATHPLAGAPIALSGERGELRVAREAALARILERSGARGPDALRALYLALYRGLRDEATGMDRASGPGESELERLNTRDPVDPRIPDHSAWDQGRLAAALAFATGQAGEPLPPPREPWLFSLDVGPVKSWVEEGRTGRDLWAGSLLLSEIAFAAMTPVLRHHGPDAILRPDLNGNPRLDRWLLDEAAAPGVLPEGADPWTHASTVVNHWHAVLPAADEGELWGWERTAEACVNAAMARWNALAQGELERLVEELQGANPEMLFGAGMGAVRDLIATLREEWERQTIWTADRAPALSVRWVACPWPARPGLAACQQGGSLPAQSVVVHGGQEEVTAKNVPGGSRRTRDAWMREREEALRPWTRREGTFGAWDAYEQAREVFARMDGATLEAERGFDYSLTLRRLDAWGAVEKDARDWPHIADPAGEACTICKRRGALGWAFLGKTRKLVDHTDGNRRAMRELWDFLGEALDEPRFGAERLCAVCLFRRRLVAPHRLRTGTGALTKELRFERVWAGSNPAPDSTGRLRIPFPSTAAVAGQRFLRQMFADRRLDGPAGLLAAALRRVRWPRTFFAAAIPGLSVREDHPLAQYDAQIYHPDAVEAELTRLGKRRDEIRAVLIEVRDFLDACLFPGPSAHLAAVAMDGDGLGRLLAGDGTRASWAEVLHPAVRERLTAMNLGWDALIQRPRLAGPALHAFITRALGDFAHRVVPWVVEREFQGRLLYAGGDDVVAFVDADDAIPMVARLQQLFSAPWVIDRLRSRQGWRHRFGAALSEDQFDPTRDRERFQIPRFTTSGGVPSQPLPLRIPRFIDPIRCVRPPPGLGGASFVEQGELFALPGPTASLSAGLAFAHFKTDMGELLDYAEEALKAAKDEGRRSGRPGQLRLRVFSRGGEKGTLCLPWHLGSRRRSDPWPPQPNAHLAIGGLVRALESGDLSGRLPYKLRAALELWEQLAQDESGQRRAMAAEEQQSHAALRDRLIAEAMREANPDQTIDGLGMNLGELVRMFPNKEPLAALMAARWLRGGEGE